MSLYADYLRERTDDSIIETPTGFATYRYINDGRSVYIIDIFVKPEKRKSGEAKALADTIAYEAKNKGCSEMLGTVNPSTYGSTESIKVLIAYGMKVKSSADNVIVFGKDL